MEDRKFTTLAYDGNYRNVEGFSISYGNLRFSSLVIWLNKVLKIGFHRTLQVQYRKLEITLLTYFRIYFFLIKIDDLPCLPSELTSQFSEQEIRKSIKQTNNDHPSEGTVLS
jgi:hypothetical protein